jgi:hypothetical protein
MTHFARLRSANWSTALCSLFTASAIAEQDFPYKKSIFIRGAETLGHSALKLSKKRFGIEHSRWTARYACIAPD